MVLKKKIRDLHIKRLLHALRRNTLETCRSLTAFTLHYLPNLVAFVTEIPSRHLLTGAGNSHTSLVHGGTQDAVCPIRLCYSGIYSSGSQAFRVRCPPSNHNAPSRAPRVPNHLRHLNIKLQRNRFKQNNLSDTFLMSVPHSHVTFVLPYLNRLMTQNCSRHSVTRITN